MKSLLNHLTRFISTALQLYAPLPFQLATDLHTLNVYLKTYSQSQEKLLEGFVNRQVHKLQEKLKREEGKSHQNTNVKLENIQQILKHYNSGSIKYPDLRLDLPTDISEKSFNNESQHQKQNSKSLSCRSDRDSQKDGIKSNRHKFGRRQRNNTSKFIGDQNNKQNVNSNVNLKMDHLSTYPYKLDQKTLKCIKSQAELTMNYNTLPRKASTEIRREQHISKTKFRYQSNQNKTSNNTAQLKIKLKPKPTIQLGKLLQNIQQLTIEMDKNQPFLRNILINAESENYLQTWIL